MDRLSAQDTRLTQIVQHDAAFVACVLRRFGVRSCDIEDARQDVFMVVHRRLPEFEPRASLRSWLYRICVCVAADYRKRAHRRRERLGEEPTEPTSEARAERLAIALQFADGLQAALAKLDPLKREVFMLYEFEELSIAEVAAQLGCPLKTAFSRLYAARRELRADLRRAGYGALGVWLLWFPPWKVHALTGAPALSAASKLTAAACAASALTIAITAIPPQPQQLSIRLEHAPHEQPLLPRDALRAEVAPAPRVEPAPRAQAARVPRARAETRPFVLAQAIESTPWIEAPKPAPQAEIIPKPQPAVGLDEVLSATSIRPLLRVGPAHQPFVLVPKR